VNESDVELLSTLKVRVDRLEGEHWGRDHDAQIRRVLALEKWSEEHSLFHGNGWQAAAQAAVASTLARRPSFDGTVSTPTDVAQDYAGTIVTLKQQLEQVQEVASLSQIQASARITYVTKMIDELRDEKEKLKAEIQRLNVDHYDTTELRTQRDEARALVAEQRTKLDNVASALTGRITLARF